jgi:hypothetical protein
LTKGQALSFDFLFSSGIFLILVSFLLIYWAYTNTQISETGKLERMIDKTQLVSDVLFGDGYPEYWAPGNIINLGLQNDNRFNQTKLNYLTSMGYPAVKDMAGVGEDEFYFRIYDQVNQTKFQFGLYPNNEENLVRLNRVGILEGDIVSVEIFVWN